MTGFLFDLGREIDNVEHSDDLYLPVHILMCSTFGLMGCPVMLVLNG
ncbi:hypothetical protein AF72_11520 [Xylella taiwanensis]|uniref:Uncharacterized protein n=1 Tax=Xylella taiwanensis TaxID=1444770 RepID=Z9JGK2_9GAMM|nr:hypothetical protein AF72_11520 [Xylella taiwanensis]